MGGVPSVPTDPSRTIQVIGAGYSRTGTVSMQMALEKLLDGPVMHGGTAILGREDAYCKKWLEVYEAHAAGDRARKLKALREATRGFVGICDLPGNNFIEELVELYPDAKVVAVHRDADKWWKSIELIMKNTTPRWLKYYLAPVPGWRHFPRMVEWFTWRGEEILTTEVQGVKDPKNIGKELLAVHNKWVASFVPPEKFLLMELQDGWEPLCKFLDKPVPNEPFPRANDAAAVEQTAKDIMTKTALVWLGIFATTGAAGYAAFKLWETFM